MNIETSRARIKRDSLAEVIEAERNLFSWFKKKQLKSMRYTSPQ